MKIKAKWLENKQFESESTSGQKAVLDSHKEMGGNDTAQTPMEALLSSLAGCMGINIVTILRRYELKSFNMSLDGDREEEWQKAYTTIHMAFKLEGDIPERIVKRAVEMSHEKYCSVSNSLKADVLNTIILNGEEIV